MMRACVVRSQQLRPPIRNSRAVVVSAFSGITKSFEQSLPEQQQQYGKQQSPALQRPTVNVVRDIAIHGRCYFHTSSLVSQEAWEDAERASHSNGVLRQQYDQLVQTENVQPDPHQLMALEALERLREDLMAKPPTTTTVKKATFSDTDNNTNSGGGGGFLSSFWGTAATASKKVISKLTAPVGPRGVYMHGGVGCGKTFLMNLFYDSITTGPWANNKQKIHFHKFMLRVHQEMHEARYGSSCNALPNGGAGASGKPRESDSILPAVIQSTLQHGKLICFDEFQVTDVADALILQRLFTGLWEEGCVVVATSNRPPDDLYLNGLQRDRFLPFIALLKHNCQVVSMEASDTDYRLIQKLESGALQIYYVGKTVRPEFNDLFFRLVGNNAVTRTALQTQGRKVNIPQAALNKGIARFTFEDLCQKALGAADYLVIGQYFDTVFVENVPVMSLTEINWLRRFIVFVDSMYECHVKLIVQAAAEPTALLQVDQDAGVSHDEVFAFGRTVSRLMEMQSKKYLQKASKRRPDIESKAAILSQRRATVEFEPALGDTVER